MWYDGPFLFISEDLNRNNIDIMMNIFALNVD